MKKQILNVAVAMSLIATLSIAGLAGVFGRLKADIPFDFMVNGKQLSAGEYHIQSGAIQGVIVLRNADTNNSAAAQAQSTEYRAGSEPRLVFRKYGSQYFLAKVVSDSTTIELPKTKAERNAAKSEANRLALNDAEPEIVTVSVSAGQ